MVCQDPEDQLSRALSDQGKGIPDLMALCGKGLISYSAHLESQCVPGDLICLEERQLLWLPDNLRRQRHSPCSVTLLIQVNTAEAEILQVDVEDEETDSAAVWIDWVFLFLLPHGEDEVTQVT